MFFRSIGTLKAQFIGNIGAGRWITCLVNVFPDKVQNFGLTQCEFDLNISLLIRGFLFTFVDSER